MKNILGLLLIAFLLTATVTVAEAATGSLEVKVLGMLFQEPKVGTQVYLDYDKIIGQIKYTNKQGIARFNGISAGTHKLKLWYNLIGFKTYSVNVKPGPTTSVTYKV